MKALGRELLPRAQWRVAICEWVISRQQSGSRKAHSGMDGNVQQTRSRLYELVGLNKAKDVIERVIQITRVDLSRSEGFVEGGRKSGGSA
jgi:hypothetical protein